MKKLVFFVSILSIAQALKLPGYITQCSKSDSKLSECLQKSLNRAWSTIAKGDNKYHIQPLNPLKVPFVHITVANTLMGNLSNAVFHGLDNIKIKDIKWDFAKRRVETKFIIPQLKYNGDYEAKGRILGLPLEGDGDCHVKFDNMDCEHYFDYNNVENDGKQYIDIKKTEMSYTTTKLQLSLTNLFNGNKHLSQAMNEILNERWEAVNKEINPYLGNVLGEIYSQALQGFFSRVSLNDFFSD